MTARYALYYAPPADNALGLFGSRWLGRDAEAGTDLGPPDTLPGQLQERWRAWTESPRFYGFHGTLKPPFALADGRSETELMAAVEDFAADNSAFEVPALRLQAIGPFLALTPSAPSSALDDFAAATVRDLDPFRAPPSDAEVAKRRAKRLSPRQEEMLVRWGYPYVMAEFRFHLTLTGALDSVEHAFAVSVLKPQLTGIVDRPVTVADLCVFHQPDRDTPFTIRRRVSLRAAG